MYRAQDALDRAFFPVEKRQTYDDKGNRIHAIVEPVGGRVISKVSDKYTLIDNRRLVSPFVDRFGMPTKVTEYANRKSYVFEFYTGREMDFGSGDIIKEKLVISNSYDKTRSFSFFFGAFRMVCTNGLFTAMASAITFKKIHVGEIPVEELIRGAIDNFEKNDFGFWKKLHDKPLSVEQEVGFVEKWVPFEFENENPTDYSPVEQSNNRIKKYTVQLITGAESVDNQRNGWGLFNKMNQAIKKEYYTPKAVLRRIQGDTRIEKYLAEALKV